MLTTLCATAIVLGLLMGRRFSFLSLLVASPAIWLISALAFSLIGKPLWTACMYALGPMAASQVAFFAGAQMRLDAQAGTRTTNDARLSAPAARSRKPGLIRALAADERNEKA